MIYVLHSMVAKHDFTPEDGVKMDTETCRG
jgi:hypothetical protein